MNTKKILTIIAIAILTILTATVITLAFVKSNFNQISLEDIQYIRVYSGNTSQVFMPEDENYTAEYNKIIDLYKSGTKEVVLSSLLTGAYSADARAEIEKLTLQGGFKPASGKMYLEIQYSQPQTVTVNGNDYVDATTNETVKYYKVFIEINNQSGLTTTTAYYAHSDSDTTASNYRISFITKHARLYEYVTELATDGILK